MPPEAAKAEEEKQDLIPPVDEKEDEPVIDTKDTEEDEESEPLNIQEAAEAVKTAVQEKAEKLEEFREENLFLSKQLATPELRQFQEGGIFSDLPKFNGQLPYIGNVMLYQATDAQVERAINDIDAREDLSATQKRETIRKIERYRGAFEDRKTQYEKQVERNLQNSSTLEWQAVESAFKDPKEGIPGIADHIPAIWEWCKTQMASSRKTKAACDASFDAKFELAVKAVRVLGIDKKLGKALSAEGRPEPDAPVGKSGSRGLQRGAANAPTFTRAQLAKLLARPEKVDEKTMAAINKALVEGRIRDK